MPTIRLTKRSIEAVPFVGSGQVLYRDDELTGFGLRVGSQAKTFFAEGQVRRRTIRVTIGRYPLISPEEARRQAFERLAAMSRGVDPVKEKAANAARQMTIAEAFDAFFEAKPRLSPVTVQNYKRTPKLYLSDWRKLPIQDITRGMVLARHRKISKESGASSANCVFRHLRSVYNFVASLHDEFPTNPIQVLSKARAWAPERRRRTLIAAHQLPAWWQAIQSETEDARDFLLVALFAEAFDAFFEAKPALSPVTVLNYERTPRLYFADWKRKPLREISREMVLSRHRKISRDHGALSANAAMRHLRLVYNFIASVHDDLPPNPVQVLSRTRSWAPERRRRTVVAAHQLPAWWRAVEGEDEDARDFLTIALFTGMRRNEIASLRWEDIDLIGQTLHLPRTKNGDPLILPLSGYLAGVIAARRERVGQSEWVFPGKGATGHLVETKSFVARVVKAAGVSFSLHDMRRTFITIAESLDIPAYALKRLLNHRTDGDVTGGYIVMSADRLRGPVERVAEKILELADGESKRK